MNIARSRILVTGGAGMIGSNLVRRLISLGCDVSIVDNLWRGKKEYLLDDLQRGIIDFDKNFYNIDLSNQGAIDQIIQNFDYLIHLADVVAGIGYVFDNQGFIFRQNILINSNVISASRKSSLKGFVYVGTACSFPGYKQTGINAKPLCEEDQYPAAPESAYGWSKLMGEYETLLMEKETGIPVSILVLHNVYGTPCDFSPKKSQVIPSLVRKAVRYPIEPFLVWGNGTQGRAFVYVDDVVDALIAALTKGLGKGVIQIGPDVCTSIQEIASMIIEISGKNIELKYDTSKPEGDKGRCADYTRAQKLLGWKPRTDIRTGLTKLYKWVENRISV